MKIIFENKYGREVDEPNIDRHIAMRWYYDDVGNFHLVLKTRGKVTNDF